MKPRTQMSRKDKNKPGMNLREECSDTRQNHLIFNIYHFFNLELICNEQESALQSPGLFYFPNPQLV